MRRLCVYIVENNDCYIRINHREAVRTYGSDINMHVLLAYIYGIGAACNRDTFMLDTYHRSDADGNGTDFYILVAHADRTKKKIYMAGYCGRIITELRDMNEPVDCNVIWQRLQEQR